LSLQIKSLQKDESRLTELRASIRDLENQNQQKNSALENLQLQLNQATTCLRSSEENNDRKDSEITLLQGNKSLNEKLVVDVQQRDLEIINRLNDIVSLRDCIHDHQAQIQTHLEAQHKAETDIQSLRVSRSLYFGLYCTKILVYY